nr:protein FAM150A [Pogona vitticeps]XP_020651642.1 protein FAM150A [Pogona vitticeps]
MPRPKKCRRHHHHLHLHALPALFFFLLFPSGGTTRVEGSSAGAPSRAREPQFPAGDKKTLLELLLKALAESSSSSRHQAHPHPVGPQRVIARRYTNGGAFSPSGSVDQEARLVSASSSSSSSRERVSGHTSRFFTSSRHSEVFPRDSNLKDKFIKHFTGPVTFSAECSKHFHRLYHNTRDCSTPAYYKRCARLLTRLAMSPLCTQP